MNLQDLKAAVESRAGTLLCERINRPGETPVVNFAHVVGRPDPGAPVPPSEWPGLDLPDNRGHTATPRV